jgi:predicted RNA-binding protein YlxR (DUF448 family)/ribosomal protein L30E
VQSVTIDRGHKKPRGPTGKAGPRRKHAARFADANAPVRTCIGCRSAAPRADLVRMVMGPDGTVVFDLSGGAFGRGAWSHPSEVCLRRAAKVMRQGGSKLAADPAFPEGTEFERIILALDEAATRRARGLALSAYRAGHLALGGDAAAETYAMGRARLVVVATDARAVKKENWLETAITGGLVVGWATKAELGALFGRDELAVFVVSDEGLARSLRKVLALRTPVTSRLAGASLAVSRPNETTAATGSHGLEDSEDG